MSEITTIGLDLAKTVFQVHGADGSGQAVMRRRLRRHQVLAFFAQLPSCVVAMEACGGAHFWGREIGKLGHDVRLIPPQLLAQHRLAKRVGPVRLKHILRQIEPDRSNLRHDRSPVWIVADPPWHIDAVGGRSHHQRPLKMFGYTVALLRKSREVRSSPFPGQTYPARCVRGVPRAVKRFRMAALI